MKKIAITGGIAEGKSTVLGYLSALGHETASADEIARAIFHEEVVQRRVSEVFKLPFPPAPANVREEIARSQRLRRELNRITHPRILQGILSSSASVIEVPLLIESCLQGAFERIWVVTCGSAEQLRRLSERLEDESRARALIAMQLPSSVKCAFADFIVRTNSDEASVQAYVTDAAARELG